MDDQLDGRLAEGTKVTGKLEFARAVRIDGQFDGDVESAGKLILGPTAEVDAEIDVGELEVQGHLNGKVKAQDRILIRNGGVVEADIVAGKLAVEAGAIFRGHCEMPEPSSSAGKGSSAGKPVAGSGASSRAASPGISSGSGGSGGSGTSSGSPVKSASEGSTGSRPTMSQGGADKKP